MGRAKTSVASFRDVDALGKVFRDQARASRSRSGPSRSRIGPWVLNVDEAGNLIAVHERTGTSTVLAVAPIEDEGGSDG